MHRPALAITFKLAITFTLVALFALPADHALAQAQPTDEEQERAVQWYEMAIAAVRDERWPEAAMAFDAAHQLDPAPELLYNAGRAYHKAGQLEKARERYNEFLVEKDASEELRKKVLEYTVELELELRRRSQPAAGDGEKERLEADLAEEQRRREDAEARARLEARLAEAERRNREFDARLHSGGGGGGLAPPPSEHSTTVRLTLYKLHTKDKPMLLRDVTGAEHQCEPTEDPCVRDLPPGEVRITLSGVSGSGRKQLRLHQDAYLDAKVIQAGSTSGGQIAGMVLLGAGAVALTVGPVIWYATAVADLVDGQDPTLDGLWISLGVATGLMLVGAVLWVVMPDDYTPTFITRDRRYADLDSDLGPTLGFTVLPVREGAALGAVGTF